MALSPAQPLAGHTLTPPPYPPPQRGGELQGRLPSLVKEGLQVVASENIRITTSEASMLLKTRKPNSIKCCNEPKTKQLRASNDQPKRKNPAFLRAPALAVGFLCRRPLARFEDESAWGTPRNAEKYKNSGNEAKEYLKTKDLTFLNAAKDAHFARKSTQIGGNNQQETPHLTRMDPAHAGWLGA